MDWAPQFFLFCLILPDSTASCNGMVTMKEYFLCAETLLHVIVKSLKLSYLKAFSFQLCYSDNIWMVYFKEDIANLFTFEKPWALNLSPSCTERCAVLLSSAPQLHFLYDLLGSSVRRSVAKLGTNALCDESRGEHLQCLYYCNCCSGFSFSCSKHWPWQCQRQPVI